MRISNSGTRNTWLAAILWAAPFSFGAEPAAPASETEIARLVATLASPDFRARDAAGQELRRIGEPALAALRDAAKNAPSVEGRTRAGQLVQRIEYGDLPGGPIDEASAERFLARGMRVSVNNGVRTMELNDGLRDIRIIDGPAGIEMTVSAARDGRVATATYRAAGRADLRAEEPQAFKLYDLWTSRFGVAPRVMQGPNGAIQIQGNVIIGPNVRSDDPELRQLADALEQQMIRTGVGVEVRKDVYTRIERIRELRMSDAMDQDEDKGNRMRLLFARSDELRRRLEELKLNDPGELLPPPPTLRLGIQFAPLPAPGGLGQRVVVDQVLQDGRGQSLGIKAGDVLRTINGKPITESRQVRPALMEAKDAMVIEVERNGEVVKLTEKRS